MQRVTDPRLHSRAQRRPAAPRSLDELARHALIHGSTERNVKHILFNLEELAPDAAAGGPDVAMADKVLAHDTLTRGDLVVPFCVPVASTRSDCATAA